MSSRQVWRFWWMASSVSCTMSSICVGPEPAAARPRDSPHDRGDRAQEVAIGTLVAAVRRLQQVVERRRVSGAHSISVRRGERACYTASALDGKLRSAWHEGVIAPA